MLVILEREGGGREGLLKDETDKRHDGEEETEGIEEIKPGDGVKTCQKYCNNEVTGVGQQADHLITSRHLPSFLGPNSWHSWHNSWNYEISWSD